MQISQNLAIENESQSLHIEVCPFNRRRIMKHQEYASDRENDEEQTGDPSQAECIRETEAVTFYLGREDMEEKVVIDQQGAFQVRIRYSSSEDRTPHRRSRNAL